MTRCLPGMVLAVFLLAGVTSGWCQQQYLYVPRPVAADEKVQKKDGVLVQEIAVRKGDTLSALSRAFSGHGSYYPQILLFNDIKDPNRIYPGNLLRIPISRHDVAAQAAGEKSAAGLTKPAAAPERKRGRKHRGAARAKAHAGSAQQQPAAAAAAPAEQGLFEQAAKAYRRNDYRRAVQLFDRFLAEYPASPLAADASLYRAECYLKQSSR
jgi:LysM repeat protein